MANLLQDVRFALRLLVRHRAVTVVAVLSLALGIGANTTVFTLVNAILLQPLVVKDVDRLVAIQTTEMRNNTPQVFGGTSRPNFEDLRDQNTVLSGASLVGFVALALSDSGEPEQVFAQMASGNFFDVLGAPMAAGRGFIPEEDKNFGEHPVTVLTYGLWQRRFGGDPAITGKKIRLNGHDFTVVGVTAQGFRGTTPVGGPELWVPFAMNQQLLTSGLPAEQYRSRRGLTYQAFGRLKDDVTIEQARANVDAIGKSLEAAFPNDNRGRSYTLVPLADGALPPAFRQQLVLSGTIGMVVVGLVLLIACGNVANLLLARASARRQEIAVRLSIGASRSRLVRQLLTESVILALAGGVVGLVIAYWARAVLWALRPPFMQATFIDLDFDGRVLTFVGIASLVTGVVFGLVPALQSSRPDLVIELKERTSQATGSRWYNIRHLLVVTQLALSLVALVSAGLFLRSLANAQQIELGFDTSGLMVMGINAGNQGYDESRGRELYRRVLERLQTVPGVTGSTLSTAVPLFAGGFARTTFRDDQDIKDPRNGRLTQINEVASRYFETIGIPILQGRAFNDADRQGSLPVIIINETMAKQFFPNEVALGRRLYIFGRPDPREIIGIAKTIKYNSVGEPETAHMYVPLDQSYQSQVIVQVRTSGDPDALLGTVRRELQALEPTMPLVNVNTYPTILRTSLWAPRFGTSLLAVFGVLALLLAAVGLYGVMSYGVSQRTREIGIRMALGASDREVRGMVVKQGLTLALGGVALGLLAAFGLARFVTSLLFGVGGADPVTFAGVAAVMIAVAIVATYIPARKASRVDPVDALRV